MCKFACESVCTCFCRTLYNSGSFPIFSAPPSTWVIYRWVWDFVEMGWGGARCVKHVAHESRLFVLTYTTIFSVRDAAKGKIVCRRLRCGARTRLSTLGGKFGDGRKASRHCRRIDAVQTHSLASAVWLFNELFSRDAKLKRTKWRLRSVYTKRIK